MLDVKLKVNSPMLADYLAYLFPPEEEGGALKVSAANSVGKLLVAHCKASASPVPCDGDLVVPLILPNDEATKPLIDKWLWYSSPDTAAVNMALSAVFDIDFNRYYLKGLELGHQKKDIVTAFIVSRDLFSADCFDALHKRAYRRSQQVMDSLTGKMLRKAYYIDSTINIKGLKDDQDH